MDQLEIGHNALNNAVWEDHKRQAVIKTLIISEARAIYSSASLGADTFDVLIDHGVGHNGYRALLIAYLDASFRRWRVILEFDYPNTDPHLLMSGLLSELWKVSERLEIALRREVGVSGDR
jgi:hypothetical protein